MIGQESGNSQPYLSELTIRDEALGVYFWFNNFRFDVGFSSSWNLVKFARCIGLQALGKIKVIKVVRESIVAADRRIFPSGKKKKKKTLRFTQDVL